MLPNQINIQTNQLQRLQTDKHQRKAVVTPSITKQNTHFTRIMTKKAKRKSMKTGSRAPTEPRNTTIPVGVIGNASINIQGKISY